jgi:hypothetical protein
VHPEGHRLYTGFQVPRHHPWGAPRQAGLRSRSRPRARGSSRLPLPRKPRETDRAALDSDGPSSPGGQSL